MGLGAGIVGMRWSFWQGRLAHMGADDAALLAGIVLRNHGNAPGSAVSCGRSLRHMDQLGVGVRRTRSRCRPTGHVERMPHGDGARRISAKDAGVVCVRSVHGHVDRVGRGLHDASRAVGLDVRRKEGNVLVHPIAWRYRDHGRQQSVHWPGSDAHRMESPVRCSGRARTEPVHLFAIVALSRRLRASTVAAFNVLDCTDHIGDVDDAFRSRVAYRLVYVERAHARTGNRTACRLFHPIVQAAPTPICRVVMAIIVFWYFFA